MENNFENINFELVVLEEKKYRYDVMVYVYIFGACCLKVFFIIYFGAIFVYVGDNIVIFLWICMLSVLKVFKREFIKCLFNRYI